MKRIILIVTVMCTVCTAMFAAIGVDMQAHMGTKEAQEAYNTYINKQKWDGNRPIKEKIYITKHRKNLPSNAGKRNLF